MSLRSTFRLLATIAVVGCSRFVWHEDPFTPDQAPTTEIIASQRDTMYVLRGASYYLLAQQRNSLWSREVMDDVAWRYRALFGAAPPTIAVRIDSVETPADSNTWRGVPLVTVAMRRRREVTDDKSKADRDREQQALADSARARLVAGPILAAAAAATWLEARALDAVRRPDSQPGGPEHVVVGKAALPAWIEAGALRILGSAGAPDRAAAELRAQPKAIVPLTTLFSVAWQGKPNVAEIVRSGAGRFDPDEPVLREEVAARARARVRKDTTGAMSPLFISQSVSVLAFIHARDPELVGQLADNLARGATVNSVLETSPDLPHDVAGLEVEWRKWLQRSTRTR